MNQQSEPSATIPLPKTWPEKVKSGFLHVLSMAKLATVHLQAEAVNDKDANPYEIEISQLKQALTTRDEMLRIMNQRMARISSHKRPNYTAEERLEILELKSVNGWSLSQTARHFLVAAATVGSWIKRIDEGGIDALVKMDTNEPVNKFPDFVRYSVQRLKTVCPHLGKHKIAEILCRAGLHLGTTTVGRILKEPPATDNKPTPETDKHAHDQLHEQETDEAQPNNHNPLRERGTAPPTNSQTQIHAKYPNHVHHVDLTPVSITGFWTTWLPFSLPQCWPFCWWVAILMDHYSRKIIGFAVFKQPPTSVQMRTFLGQAMARAKAVPKHLISDKGCQFWCQGYKKWCKRKGIKPRFGAVGKHGSIAVVERINRTFKEFTRSLPIVSMFRKKFRQECTLFFQWYNDLRPHMTLKGKTPSEAYFREKFPANRKPRIEPRERWPRGSPCAKPQPLIAGQPGDRFILRVESYKGLKQLPIVTLIREKELNRAA